MWGKLSGSGLILYVTENSQELFGRFNSELIGSCIFEFIAKKDHQAIKDVLLSKSHVVVDCAGRKEAEGRSDSSNSGI